MTFLHRLCIKDMKYELPNTRYLVIVEDTDTKNDLIATVTISIHDTWAHLNNFVVHEDYQKKGVGNTLMLYVRKLLEIEYPHINLVSLSVKKDNEKAIAFYKKQGFKITQNRNVKDDVHYMSYDIKY